MIYSIEPTIVGKHDLNISTVHSLAKDIASRLPINIEYGEYNNEYNKLGTITTNTNYPLYTLADQRSINGKDQISYALVCGDFAIIIYNEIMELHFPFEIEYKSLEEAHHENQNGLLDEPFVAEYFRDMSSLGSSETYIFDNEDATESLINFGYECLGTWEILINKIKADKSYFIEPKQV